MDSSALKSGLAYEFKFRIPENQTVPFLYPSHNIEIFLSYLIVLSEHLHVWFHDMFFD